MKRQPSVILDRLNLKQYFKNKAVRNHTTFIYRPTGSFYSMDGALIPAQQFDEMYPLTMVINDNPKGTGKDGRTNWY